MHGLRLITFPENNKTPIQDNIKVKRNLKLLVQGSNLKDENVSDKPQVEKVQQSLRAKTQRKTIEIQKSLNEIFGRPSYDIPTKKIIRKVENTLVRKRKLLSNTTLNNGTPKEKWRNINKTKKKIKRKKEQRFQEIPKDENIKVLFMSKNWKEKKLCSLLSHTKNIRKYAINYNSKSLCDLDLVRHKNTNVCCRMNTPQVKLHYKNTNSKRNLNACGHKHCHHFYSDHAIQSKNTLEKDYCRYNYQKLSGTYNVVDFPYITPNIPEKMNVCEGTTNEYNTQSPCKNKQIGTTTSCLLNSNGGGDTIASLVLSKPNPQKNLQRLKSSKILLKHQCKNKRKKSLRSTNHRSIFLVKVLKYILFGLSIVIWSPCIVIIALLSAVTYPMRPQEIINTVNDVESCKYDSRNHYDENNFLSSIYTCVVNAIKKLLNIYEAVFSLLKNDQGKHTYPRVRSCSLLSHLAGNHKVKLYPNPRKRYKLFYDIKRGWVIKTTKKRNDHCFDPLKEETILKKNHTSERSKTNYENEVQKYIQIKEHNVPVQCPVVLGINNPKMSDTKHIANQIQNNKNTTMNCVDKHCTLSENKWYTNGTKCTCEPQQIASHLCESNNARTQARFLKTNSCSKPVFQEVLSPFNPLYYSDQQKRFSKLPYHNETTSIWPSHRCQCKPIKQKQVINHKKYVYPRNVYCQRYIKQHLEPRSQRINRGRTRIKQYKYKNTIKQQFRDFRKKTMCMIKDAESIVWNSDKCENLHDSTLQNRPWSWVHRRWPTFYPYFIAFCKFYENLAYALLYIFTVCIWCPIFCWCYMCCNFFCRCVL